MTEEQKRIRTEAIAHLKNVQDAAKKFVNYKTLRAQGLQLKRMLTAARDFECDMDRYCALGARPTRHMKIARRRPRRGRRSVA